MFSKRTLIVFLGAINVVLFCALLAATVSLPRALAQPGGGRGEFICVTAKAGGQSYDVLYLLDAREQKLHGFFPQNIQTAELGYIPFRDLKEDFGRP